MSGGEGDDYGLRKGWRRPENPPRAGTGELLQRREGRSGWQETQRGVRITGPRMTRFGPKILSQFLRVIKSVGHKGY